MVAGATVGGGDGFSNLTSISKDKPDGSGGNTGVTETELLRNEETAQARQGQSDCEPLRACLIRLCLSRCLLRTDAWRMFVKEMSNWTENRR